jgi:peptidyl-prolyl cis-trans isomerase C
MPSSMVTALEQDEEEIERKVTESLRIQKYLNDFVLVNLDVPESEVRKYYNEHASSFVRNDVVHVREILVGDRAQAEKILAALKENRNKNFAELARLYSKAPTAGDGGDLGKFERGDLPKDFEREIFRLSPATVSKIMPSEHGYHIFLVEEKILAHQQKFYEVKDQIREQLLLERGRAIIEEDMEQLMRRIPVAIDRDRLGFEFEGNRYSSGGGNTQ